MSLNIHANCDTFQYKRDLKSGFHISLYSNCPISIIKELGHFGKERVTIHLQGFSEGMASEMATFGVLLNSNSNNFPAKFLIQLAKQSSNKLTINLHGLSTQVAEDITDAGANVVLDHSFTTDEASKICQKVSTSAQGVILTQGYSGNDLLELSKAGCIIDDIKQRNMNYVDVEKILSIKGRIKMDSHITGVRAIELAAIGKDSLTVELGGFGLHDARTITENGANIHISNIISGFEAQILCHLLKPPAIGKVNKHGFSDYDLARIVEAGCSVYY